MKRIIFFGLLVLSLAASAQDKPSYFIGLPGQTAHARGNLRVDSVFLNALKDTLFTPWRLGLQVFRPADSSLYISTSLVAASKWTKLGAASGSAVWGTITGTLSSQTDLQAALDGKQDTITTGTTSQYLDGTLALRNFSSEVTALTDPLYSALSHTHNGLAPVGGNTGQVLTKNSNTNYDYSWTTVGTGTVTNVATGLWLSGGPITSTGTIIADSASMAAYFLRRKDSSTATNPDGYLTLNNISGTDTTIFQTVLDSTGQAQHRVLFSGGNNKIKSDSYFIFDSTNNKLVINHNNVSIGGPNTKLFVKGNATVADAFTMGNGIISTTPTTSAGAYDILTRNTSNGNIEKILSSSFLTPADTINKFQVDSDTVLWDATKTDITNAIAAYTETDPDFDANGVKLTGNQTIAGIKTFSSGVVAPSFTESAGLFDLTTVAGVGALYLANGSATDIIRPQAASLGGSFRLPNTGNVQDTLFTFHDWRTLSSGLGGGYTNLTQFVAQTAHRLFYSDASGDVQELAFGASGTVLQSNGTTSAPSFGSATIPTLQQVLDAGSTLSTSETINVTNPLIFSGNSGSNATLFANNLNSSGITMQLEGSNGLGLYSVQSGSGTGVSGASSSGDGIAGISTTGNPIAAYYNNSDASSVINMLQISRLSTGSELNGMGGKITYSINTDASTLRVANELISKFTIIADGSRTSQFDITGVNSTSQETFANFQTGGIVRVNNNADTLATRDYARSVGGGGGSYTDEQAQDAVGAMIDGSLAYVDGTPLLQRAALTGDVTASAGSNATTIAAGAVDIAMLSATGTPSSTTYLRGDNTWATIAAGGDVTKVGTPVDNQLGVWTGDGTLEGPSTLTYNGTQLYNSAGGTSNSQARIGALEIQSYAVNNLWFGDNAYYDGSGFKTRSIGAAMLFYSIGTEGFFKLAPSTTAGSVPAFTTPIRFHTDGRAGLGGNMTGAGGDLATGAALYINTSSEVLIGTADQGVAKLQLGGAISAAEMATPSTPGTGYAMIYPKSDGLWYGKDDAGTERAMNVTQHASFGISAPSASEDAMLFFTPVAIKVTNVQEALVGSSPSVTYTLNYGSARNSATGTIVASHAATSTTGAAATLNVTSIPANSYIWLTTSATSGTVNDFHVTINYYQ